MPIVIARSNLPPKESSLKELILWGDTLAQNTSWTRYAPTTSLSPKTGYPQRQYIKDGKLVFVQYSAFAKNLTPSQNQWGLSLHQVSVSSRNAVKWIWVHDIPSCEELVSVLSA